jgi:hypothetical protein
MNWPEAFWLKIYEKLPDDADRVEFRKAVEAAIIVYEREAPDLGNTPPWAQMIKAFDEVLDKTRQFNLLWGTPRRHPGTPRRAGPTSLMTCCDPGRTRPLKCSLKTSWRSSAKSGFTTT